MNREVQKFKGAYVNYKNQPHSGENDTDLYARAEEKYYQDMLKVWKYGHAWRVVKDNGKWQNLPLMDDVAKRGKRRSKLSTQHLPTTQDDPYDLDLDDDIPAPASRTLPIGRDRAKKKAKTSSSSSARSEEYSEIRNQFATLNANITSRNKLKAMEIYMSDVSHLQGEALERAMTAKEMIRKEYGL